MSTPTTTTSSPASPLSPMATIAIGGWAEHVVFTMGTLLSIERAMGRSIMQMAAEIGPALKRVEGEEDDARRARIGSALGPMLTVESMRSFVAGCLRMTGDEVDAKIPLRNFKDVHAALWVGFLQALVDLLGGEDEGQSPKAAGPGPSGSGPDQPASSEHGPASS